MLYPGHSLVGGSYPSAEKSSVYSTAPTQLTGQYILGELRTEDLCINEPQILSSILIGFWIHSFFSETDNFTSAKELSLPNYICWGEKRWIHVFPQDH